MIRDKQPGPWQVFDIETDPQETTDLAVERPELIRQAEELLKREMSPNKVFPVKLPE